MIGRKKAAVLFIPQVLFSMLGKKFNRNSTQDKEPENISQMPLGKRKFADETRLNAKGSLFSLCSSHIRTHLLLRLLAKPTAHWQQSVVKFAIE